MSDPRLNLFWNYSVPDRGVADSGLGTHEDNITRGLIVTLRLLGVEATTEFLKQAKLPVAGSTGWHYHLHRTKRMSESEVPFLLGIHAEGGAAEPRYAGAESRIPDAVLHAPGQFFILIEAKKRGQFDNHQLSGHFKTLAREVAPEHVQSHPSWQRITWQQVGEIIRGLDGTAGGKLVAQEYVVYLQLQGMMDEFHSDIFEAQVRLWQETHSVDRKSQDSSFVEARSIVAHQLDVLAAKTGGGDVWYTNKESLIEKRSPVGRFYSVNKGDSTDISIRRKAQYGDPKLPGNVCGWACGHSKSNFLWSLSWYIEAGNKAGPLPNLPFSGGRDAVVCTKNHDELRIWEQVFDKAADDFAALAPKLAQARNYLIERLCQITSLGPDDAARRVTLTGQPIVMHPSKYLWQGANVDPVHCVDWDSTSMDVKKALRAFFRRPGAKDFPAKGAFPEGGFPQWRKMHPYQKGALSLRVTMDGLLSGLSSKEQLERFKLIQNALVESVRATEC